MKRILIIIIALYVAGFVVTFGHARNRAYATNASLFSSENDRRAFAITDALFGSFFWPLYWSDVYWSTK